MDETGDLDQLERQTAQLRRQMALDADEMVRRMNPRRFVGIGVAYPRKTRSALGKTQPVLHDAAGAMKQDPIPYLMIGVGAAGATWAATSFCASALKSDRTLKKRFARIVRFLLRP